MDIFGIQYSELLKKAKILPGMKVKILRTIANGQVLETVSVKVVKVYRHHVLLDFGQYKECRRIADIILRPRGTDVVG